MVNMIIKNEIIEELKIEENINENIYISNVIATSIDLSFMTFIDKVRIEECYIDNLFINSSWFNNGFELHNCIIKNKIQYEMGGHNNSPIVIKNNIFCNTFIFLDCHFFDELTIKENIFNKGCTILGSSMNNTFDKKPEIFNNIGDVYINQID